LQNNELHAAVEAGDYDKVKKLVEEGHNLFARNTAGLRYDFLMKASRCVSRPEDFELTEKRGSRQFLHI
jgi:hypothetical protein